MSAQHITTLEETDLFGGLDGRSLHRLVERGKSMRFEPKEFVFHEGFEGDYFFLLIDGSIRVFKTSIDGKESTIKIIHAGEIFAEAVLFGNHEYPASGVATLPSTIYAIHRDSFWAMLEEEDTRDRFIEVLFGKLRYLTGRIHELTSLDVEDRFFMFLRDNYGRKEEYAVSIPKKDVAAAIGTIPETFSRLLLRLTRRGILVWKGNTIRLKDGFWDESDYG